MRRKNQNTQGGNFMGPQFHETVYGQRFFDTQLPNLIKNLEILAKWEMKLSKEENRTYVCYHENSFALEPETGKISEMIATNDLKGALVWLNESLTDAKKNNYCFVKDGEADELYEALANCEDCERILVKKGEENHTKFFKICMHSYL